MALQVAACPRCRSALVFGEQQCVACGQTFQYGANAPPLPTAQQVAEALAAAGAPPRAQAPAPPQAAVPRSVAVMEGIDTGRFEDVGEVELVHVSGLINADLFKALTPKDVDAPPIAGLDAGRFDEAPLLPMAAPADLERTVREEDPFAAVALPMPPVSGLFGSNIYDARHVEVAPPPVEGIQRGGEVRARPKGPDTRTQAQKDAALEKVVCRCGESHRLPRCLACGTPHPERA